MNFRPAPHALISKSKVSPGVILEVHNVAESKLYAEHCIKTILYVMILFKKLFMLNE